jgi:hypothetical protein
VREPSVRIADRAQYRDGGVLIEVPVLIVEIAVDVVAHPQVQGQPPPHPPIVLNVGLHLRDFVNYDLIGRDAGVIAREDAKEGVGSRQPLPHGPRRLKPLRIFSFVAENRRGIIKERELRR